MQTCGKNIKNEDLREAIKGHGLGTAATRAEVIENLIKDNYVVREKTVLTPTEKGMKVIK